MPEPLSLFYSYAHEDDRHRVLLDQHLAALRREGLVDTWDDRRIVPGTEWEAAIAERLQTAEVVVLLISAAFIASDYCWGREMQVALKRHEAGRARVVPVIVKPVDWMAAPFAALQVLPANAKPVTRWGNRDSAWLDVAQGVRQAVAELTASLARQPPGPEEPVVEVLPPPVTPQPARGAGGRPNRVIYDANEKERVPGDLVRREGDAPTGDAAVDETFDSLGAFFDFFWTVYGRDSVDDAGLPLTATVHYGEDFDNAFWNGTSLVIGDGWSFARFTSVDVVAKEMTKAIVQHEAGLEYWGQSGALIDSISTVFGVLVQQHRLGQTADQADWLLGAALFGPERKGRALVDLAAPGTAYLDPVLGGDRQPGHMRDYVETDEDSGGLHINSGIPNHAFHLLAMELGGHAWTLAGRIWYEASRSGRVPPDATFRQFARMTVRTAAELYGEGSDAQEATRRAWDAVGVL